jgi:MFS family permease
MGKAKNTTEIQGSKPGLYYGYTIAILAFCIILVVYGLRFSYGVFFNSMSLEMGWNNATTSLVYSVSMIMEGIFNIILGGVIDRYGPRLVVTISGLLIALGYCLMPTATSTWQLFLFYSGLIGIGMGGLFAPLVTIIARWFTAKRNLMTGLVISSVGIGVLIVSPLANWIIIIFDWRMTFLIFGIVILLITTICAQFLKRDPSSIGILPYGEDTNTKNNRIVPVHSVSFGEAIRSCQFWFVFIMLFSYGYCTNSVSIHLVPDLVNLGTSSTVSANVLAMIGGSQIVGRVGLGMAADKTGNKFMFILGFALFALLVFWLPGLQSMWSFFVFAAFFGIAQGGMASSQSPLVASLFGLKSLGLLFGCCGFGFTIGAALGPYITGHIRDISGNYQMAFLICTAVSLIALIISIALRPLKNLPPRRVSL